MSDLTCIKCKQLKTTDDFYVTVRGGKTQRKRNCKECEKEYARTEGAKKRKLRKQERINDYIERFGNPKCQCGCGRSVNFDFDGRPYKFVNGHSGDLEERVPNDKVIEVMNRLKTEKNLTAKEMAEICGLPIYQMQKYLYKRKSNIGIPKKEVEHILRRLAGLPTQMTSYELERLRNKSIIKLPGGISVDRF